ncbi:MAG: hypothetical protein AAGD10_08770 [Myxococcota bacterium]
MKRRILTWVTAFAFACSAETLPPEEEGSTVEATSETVEVSDEVDVPALPPDEPEAELIRDRRRMDVDQLDASLRRFSGGIGWMVGNRNRLEELAPTLGRPDYIQIVDEDLSPSAMFQKFLDDAARSVCAELMVVDPQREPEARTFFLEAEPTDDPISAPEVTQANLRRLLLRAHGARASEAELEPWSFLMQSVMQVGGDSIEAWKATCVGLLTHPEFFTY